MTVAPNLGTGGAVLDAVYGSSAATEPLLLGHTGENYLYLPGVAGNYASTPDAAALDITGDIDIRVRVALDDWTPPGTSALISKYASAGNISWRIVLLNTGVVRFTFTTDGTTLVNKDSTVVTGFTDGTAYWLKVTVDVDNGAAGYDVKFWWAADAAAEPGAWTQLGTTVTTATATSIFASTAMLEVGTSINGTASPIAGKVYRAIVRDGIGGTTVFDADFTSGITSGAQTTFTESSSNAATVTINRSTAGRKACAVVRPVWLLGTDDFFEVADNALLDFGAGDDFTVVAVVRQWGTPTNNGVYVNKRDAVAPNTGYRFQSSGTSLAVGAGLDDGPNFVSALTSAVSAGTVVSVGLVVDRSAQTVRSFANSTLSSTASVSAVGSLENSFPFRIGAIQGGVNHQDFECLAVAVFRRALTAAELSTIATYYGAI
jgi:hypothetical protein